jgi:hypothetical protein
VSNGATNSGVELGIPGLGGGNTRSSPWGRTEPVACGDCSSGCGLPLSRSFAAAHGRIYPLVTPLMELWRTAVNAFMTAWQVWEKRRCAGACRLPVSQRGGLLHPARGDSRPNVVPRGRSWRLSQHDRRRSTRRVLVCRLMTPGTPSPTPASAQAVPYACLKQRPSPVVSGQQGAAPLRHESGVNATLSCADGHTSWSVRGAGDRDRTGMASLEGWGSTIELHPRDCVTERVTNAVLPLRENPVDQRATKIHGTSSPGRG